MDAWGVADGYWDVRGSWCTTSDDTRAAIHRAMGVEGDGPATRPYWSVLAGTPHVLHSPCDVTLEDGTLLAGIGALPPDLPIGYHRLQPLDGGPSTRLVVRPGACPEAPHGWGWAVQTYALRTARSWGIGDLGDLRELATWSCGLGGDVLQVSPLHANPPVRGQQPSPYFPSSRRWRNVLLVRVTEVPGVAAVGAEVADIDALARDLSGLPTIDREAALQAKLQALGSIFDASPPPEAFHRWRAARGTSIERWGAYVALAERHGQNWTTWPGELRHPDDDAVARAVAPLADRVTFHAWCQWLVEEQLAAVARTGAKVVGDLAVGFDSCGFDAWCDQDLLALDCTVGAPPDLFAPDGQDWGLPPYVPWKLARADYGPLVETIRANLRNVQGLRLDHVMALSRLYWIPVGLGAAHGAYVYGKTRELVDVVVVEAHRAGAFVIGEDLGTVEDELREALVDAGILGTLLGTFEPGDPSGFREDALATMTTHDLPTAAGLLTGADQAMLARLGRRVDQGDMHARLAAIAGPAARTVDEVVPAAYRSLAAAPSRLVLATLEDAVQSVRRPNLPGTIDEYPNWRIPLPLTVEELSQERHVRELVDALREGRAMSAAARDADEPTTPAPAAPVGGG